MSSTSNSTRIFAAACALLTLSFIANPCPALAQGTATSQEPKPTAGGPRKQLATIIYAGLGGAVLGLSTLSFYGRPQDKLANIAIGFAVGVIVGTAVVTVNAATNPDDFYGPNDSNRQGWRYDRSVNPMDLANDGSGPEIMSSASSPHLILASTPLALNYEFRF